MGFGAGHMQDMNNRLKQNRAQRSSKRSKFKGNNREVSVNKKKTPLHFHFESGLEAKKIKKRLKRRNRLHTLTQFLVYVLIIGFIVIVSLSSI
ncbi:hypothetical protein DXU93_10190 [Brumimicrobium aurantiacum]|uniref:Uncharacterized protein n=1 Tax=Brumimicrobium aurantiacum TaxID=1737063 RepID=A0A3E1EWK9_9FLAO|nr:hypothetical protein DXU93_10190 [Brumimicrobium aurantiacum]